MSGVATFLSFFRAIYDVLDGLRNGEAVKWRNVFYFAILCNSSRKKINWESCDVGLFVKLAVAFTANNSTAGSSFSILYIIQSALRCSG